jgi:rare lipoprotein A
MRHNQLRLSFAFRPPLRLAAGPALVLALAFLSPAPSAAQQQTGAPLTTVAQQQTGAPLTTESSGPSGSAERPVYTGVASWYGADFHGRPTSSGEVYDKEAMTAAHRSLPFGTLLLVTSLDTKASVVVRVNDRGPFAKDRVLDLSEAAARIIGMVPTGTARVSFRELAPEEAAAFGAPRPSSAPAVQPPAPALPAAAPSMQPTASAQAAPSTQAAAAEGRLCRIQVASYRDAKNAESTLQRLRLSGLPEASIEVAGAYQRVVFAELPASRAESVAAKLRDLGYLNLLITWY